MGAITLELRVRPVEPAGNVRKERDAPNFAKVTMWVVYGIKPGQTIYGSDGKLSPEIKSILDAKA